MTICFFPVWRVRGDSLLVQWLRLCCHDVSVADFILTQGSKIPHAACHSQNKIKNKTTFTSILKMVKTFFLNEQQKTVAVQEACCCSITPSCPTLCNPMDCSMPSFLDPHHFQELAQTHVHGVGNAIQPSHPPPVLLPSIFPSNRVFSNESALCFRWPKYWSFSISPSNEYSRLISFKIDRFDLAVQGTLKSPSQHHSWKASILPRSAFFVVQLSHPYMTTGA